MMLTRKQMTLWRGQNKKEGGALGAPGKYYIVDSAVLPEVFTKVIEVKELLVTGEARTINEATAKVGISRSAFYKYKDTIRPFNDMLSGRIVTLRLTLKDQPGALSNALQGIAAMGGNVLTINQSVPAGGVAEVTLDVETSALRVSMEELLGSIRTMSGVLDCQTPAGQ